MDHSLVYFLVVYRLLLWVRNEWKRFMHLSNLCIIFLYVYIVGINLKLKPTPTPTPYSTYQPTNQPTE